MTSFLDALQHEGTKTARTENGAVTHSTSVNAVLDFFALAGAMRNNINDAKTLFRKALHEDRQLAIRALFYLRDIRGGQGERQLFRELFRELIRIDLPLAERVLQWIPEYGRWDDVVSVYGLVPDRAAALITDQLYNDNVNLREGKGVSLLAKWLPSENASSANSRTMARQLATDLGMSNKEYRKQAVALRKHIGLLEQKMSENDWDEIQYDKIPSQAGRKHSKAFKRHDEYRYEDFLTAVMSGEKKMNAGTVFTYEVLDAIRKGQEQTANAIWKSLPDWTNGENALVVADVSGSMGDVRYGGGPIDVSVSLALYFAERNTGAFKDLFITFSSRPELVKVVGRTLTQKLMNIGIADWGYNTNIQAVFDLVLKAAVEADSDATDIPKVIYIISDMEFDQAASRNQTNFEVAKQKFANHGFVLPHIVFWNVAARNTNVPATAGDRNVTLISGLSQSTFQYAVAGKTPLESMLDILNGERYAQITV